MTDPAHRDAMELPRHEPPETLDIDRMQRIAARLREDAAERRGYLRGLEDAAEAGKEAAKRGCCHHVAAAIRALAEKEPRHE